MHAKSALFVDPALLFLFQKKIDALLLDRLQVFDLAHPVLRAIAGIQALDALAGEAVAIETVFPSPFFTLLDGTVDADLIDDPAAQAARAAVFAA